MATPDFAIARRAMVETQLRAAGRDIQDPRILEAMNTVPRHEFVPAAYQTEAYEDHPLPIGSAQTVSQPYIVAYMTACLRPQRTDRVLEVGTGCGYQAAILSLLVAEVFTLEIIEPLARQAQGTLHRLGFQNVSVRTEDGHGGWPEAAPFNGIIVTCAPERVPTTLAQQLAEGGRMVVPVGGYGEQRLVLIEREGNRIKQSPLLPVRFVLMTGGTKRSPNR